MNVPVGKNTLSHMLSAICKRAALPRRTNHFFASHRATQLLHAIIPEKVKEKPISHLSLGALRMHENVSDEEHLLACSIVVSKPGPSSSHPATCSSTDSLQLAAIDTIVPHASSTPDATICDPHSLLG